MIGYFERLGKRNDDKAKRKRVMGGSKGVLPVNSSVHYQDASFQIDISDEVDVNCSIGGTRV